MQVLPSQFSLSTLLAMDPEMVIILRNQACQKSIKTYFLLTISEQQ